MLSQVEGRFETCLGKANVAGEESENGFAETRGWRFGSLVNGEERERERENVG